MSALQRFTHRTGQSIRTVVIDGAPWFVAGDVARALGYRMASDMTRRLDPEDRGTHSARTPGGDQDVTVISEAGLYSSILGSQVPGAREFKRWVTREVIPSIRRTGGYALADAAPVPLSYPEALRELAATVEQRDAERARAAELEPDAERARHTIDTTGLSNVSTVAKRFGMREKDLRAFLWAEGLLMQRGHRRNEPYARWMGRGYFEVKVTTIRRTAGPESRSVTYITPAGEAMIWHRLYGAGLVARPTPPPVHPTMFDGLSDAA